MEDISPKLLNRVQTAFNRSLKEDRPLAKLREKISAGKATYKEAHAYAERVGEHLKEAFSTIAPEDLPDGRMYYNIASKVISPVLQNDHELVAEVCEEVQESINEQAGIGMKAIVPKYDQSKVDGIIDYVSNAEEYSSLQASFLQTVGTYTEAIVDESVQLNAEAQAKAGIPGRFIRTRGPNENPKCSFCAALATPPNGIDYDDVDEITYNGYSFFARHRDCHCIIEYFPGNGIRQNSWSKATYKDEAQAVADGRQKYMHELAEKRQRIEDMRQKHEGMSFEYAKAEDARNRQNASARARRAARRTKRK